MKRNNGISGTIRVHKVKFIMLKVLKRVIDCLRYLLMTDMRRISFRLPAKGLSKADRLVKERFILWSP